MEKHMQPTTRLTIQSGNKRKEHKRTTTKNWKEYKNKTFSSSFFFLRERERERAKKAVLNNKKKKKKRKTMTTAEQKSGASVPSRRNLRQPSLWFADPSTDGC